jgi:hypothetical protein
MICAMAVPPVRPRLIVVLLVRDERARRCLAEVGPGALAELDHRVPDGVDEQWLRGAGHVRRNLRNALVVGGHQ